MRRKPKKKGARVDKLVKAAVPGLTKRHIEEALAEGLVCLADGKRTAKGQRLEDGALSLEKLVKHVEELRKAPWDGADISVVGETDDEWFIDKPAGVPSHPISLFDRETVTHWGFAQSEKVRSEFPEIQPTITPHRLDTGTSGILVVCKNRGAFEKWRERFHNKEVVKTYSALCWGIPTWDATTVELALAHDRSDRRKMYVVPESERTSIPVLWSTSQVECVQRYATHNMFLAKVTCTTGVMHQVRVHLAHLGHPLVGDSLYDKSHPTRPVTPPHHALRATELKWNNITHQVDDLTP